MSPSRTVERGMWSEEEHDKFLAALKVHPKGPWKIIAAQVGTRSSRQVQTHAQKYYEKVARRLRGLRKDRKKLVRPEHRLDEDMMKLCQVSVSLDDAISTIATPSSPMRQVLDKAATTSSSPVGVESIVTDADATCESDCSAATDEPESFMKLLGAQSDFLDVSDSDDADSLADVDDYYLDFLIDALDCSSDCTSDDGSSESDAFC